MMTHDEAEFLISQQLDGTLDAADAQRLHAAIDSDAIVAAMWREHQALDAALRGSRIALDPSEAEPMLAQIAAAIDDADERATRTIKLSSFNWRTPLAAAATLAIGLTIGIFSARSGSHTTPPPIIAVNHNEASPAPSNTAAALPIVPTITIAANNGADAVEPTPASDHFASVAVGTPANLTPSYVASLYVSDTSSANDRVVIEAAGHAVLDSFE